MDKLWIYSNIQVQSPNPLEQLHQRSVCDPALEMLDESHEYNPVNPLDDCLRPEKESDKHSQIVFSDCSLFLIG